MDTSSDRSQNGRIAGIVVVILILAGFWYFSAPQLPGGGSTGWTLSSLEFSAVDEERLRSGFGSDFEELPGKSLEDFAPANARSNVADVKGRVFRWKKSRDGLDIYFAVPSAPGAGHVLEVHRDVPAKVNIRERVEEIVSPLRRHFSRRAKAEKESP